MGKGTKKKKNNSVKQAIKNAELNETTKSVATETTSTQEMESEVVEQEMDLEIENNEEEVECEISLEDEEEVDYEEESDIQEAEYEEIDETEVENTDDVVEEVEYEEIEEKPDYNEIIKKVAKKEKYNIKIEDNKKESKEKLSLNLQDNEVGNLIKIILVITGVVLVLYFVTVLYLKKDEVKEDTETEVSATIQYDEILSSKLLTQSPKDYYVFAYNEEDFYLTTYETLLSNYQMKENAKKVYKLNLDLGFNKNIIGEESNLKGANLEKIKFTQTSLIRVKKNKIVEAYEGKEAILEHLRSLTK